MISFSAISAKDSLKNLESDLSGLSKSEVEGRLKKYGPNRLPAVEPLSSWEIFYRQLKNPFIIILLAAGLICLLLKEYIDLQVILGAVLINVLIGFFQERQANRALESLRRMVRQSAIVLRQGEEQEVLVQELVPGDIIILRAGYQVPADCRVLSAVDLEVNEAVLTGESMPVEKLERELPAGTILAERKNMLYSTTVVLGGSAKALVVGTGVNTEIGKITQLIKQTKDEPTPLQDRLAKLSRLFGLIALAACSLMILIGVWQGRPLFQIFITAVAVAVAAIPEGMVVAVTVILVLGMKQIVRRQALIRNLAAAETLGSVTVICTDKTGTLTAGEMRLSHFLVGDIELEVASIKQKEKIANDILTALEIGLLCNDAVWIKSHDELQIDKIIGSPLEAAILRFGAEWGWDYKKLNQEQPRVGEKPFDSERKVMISIHRIKKSKFVWYEKGAPEIILAKASHFLQNGKILPLDNKERQRLKRQFEKWTGQGLRLIALAYKDLPEWKEGGVNDFATQENNLVFAALMAFKDPLRPEAKATVAACLAAGIRPLIITGDYPLTAQAIAREVGLVDFKNVISGSELDKIGDRELRRLVKKISVFARVVPAHKLRIVKALKANGEVVAMTGDGLNDAPALKAADIGIALGSGTEVAKDTADMVLLDNNFKVIMAAIEEGRLIFQNIRKSVAYLASDCFSELILIIASIIAATPLAILPTQILWINIINDGFPNFSLAFERSERGLMERKPLKRTEPLVNGQVKVIVLGWGIVRDVVLAAIFVYGYYHLDLLNWSLEYWRTMFFVLLAVKSITGIFSLRNLNLPIWKINHLHNIYLLLALFLSSSLLVLAVYVPFFQRLLDTVALDFSAWVLIFSLSLANIFLMELIKLFFNSKFHGRTRSAG